MSSKQIVSLHIGQAGVQMGSACWELLAGEHGVKADGTISDDYNSAEGSIETFFQETPAGQFVPRCIMIDTEPNCIDEIRTGVHQKFFHPDLLINGMEDAASNYARGRNVRGEIMEAYNDSMRLVAEDCDKLEGFLIFDAFGGGTGSGFGTNAIDSLLYEFHRFPRVNLGIFPSPDLTPVVVAPYNSMLFMNDLLENADLSFILDNKALYNVCKNNLKFGTPNYHDINRLCAQVVSQLTSSVRYEMLLNNNLTELRTNLVPYPKFKFPVLSYAPMVSPMQQKHETNTIDSLNESVFDCSNHMIDCDLRDGYYMSNCLMYRGDVCGAEVNKSLRQLKSQHHWVSWCPTGFKIGICPTKPLFLNQSPMASSDRSVLLLSNSTAIRNPIEGLRKKFQLMYCKKAFIHWYIGEGLEETEFVEAYENIMILEEDFKIVEKQEGTKEAIVSRHYAAEAKRKRSSQKGDFETPPPIGQPMTPESKRSSSRQSKGSDNAVKINSSEGRGGESATVLNSTDEVVKHEGKNEGSDELPKNSSNFGNFNNDFEDRLVIDDDQPTRDIITEIEYNGHKRNSAGILRKKLWKSVKNIVNKAI